MSARTRVLVVDDEPAIQRFLKPALEANDCDVESAGTVAEAMKLIASRAPDIVVLDLGLPDGDGKDVISKVREWSDVPIVVLSARDREAEKIARPRPRRRRLRQQAVRHRRIDGKDAHGAAHRMLRHDETPVLRTGNIEIDSLRHEAKRGGELLKLTPKEFELLSFLARHAGKVITHRQILTAVWGPAHTEDTQYLRVYIGQLRQKIEPRPDDPQIILTEPGHRLPPGRGDLSVAPYFASTRASSTSSVPIGLVRPATSPSGVRVTAPFW